MRTWKCGELKLYIYLPIRRRGKDKKGFCLPGGREYKLFFFSNYSIAIKLKYSRCLKFHRFAKQKRNNQKCHLPAAAPWDRGSLFVSAGPTEGAPCSGVCVCSSHSRSFYPSTSQHNNQSLWRFFNPRSAIRVIMWSQNYAPQRNYVTTYAVNTNKYI